ncbi:MAG: glutathione S-transferase family protein [Gammaproteobacteria bacterium]|nr:glutathione S-transferase family protein [Gammaproteobacteria bacterium]MBT8444393.1 glutathione S-transferase family protein [Gammaproteobacteria bacterium]
MESSHPGLQLIGAAASPYVTRVVMFARLKGVAFDWPPVPGDNPRSAAYHALNPLGKVPGLVVNGEMIPESEVICEYLEDAYPEPSGLPADVRGRTTSRLVARITDLYISPNFRPLLPHLDPATRDHAEAERIGAALAKAFRSLEFYMGPGAFCVGEVPTLGDCALGPYIQLLKHMIFPAFEAIPDPTLDGRLATWWRALQDHDLCKTCLDEYDAGVAAFLAENYTTLSEHN